MRDIKQSTKHTTPTHDAVRHLHGMTLSHEQLHGVPITTLKHDICDPHAGYLRLTFPGASVPHLAAALVRAHDKLRVGGKLRAAHKVQQRLAGHREHPVGTPATPLRLPDGQRAGACP